MDYSAVIDSIRAERLELVEILTEHRLQLLDTLHSFSPDDPAGFFACYSTVLQTEGRHLLYVEGYGRTGTKPHITDRLKF